MTPRPHNFIRKITFFEGLDKTGKTTLSRRCRFEADPAHPALMFDRGFIGRRVFWHANNETHFPIEEWLLLEKTLRDANALAVVWLRANIDVIVRRHREAGETPAFSVEEFMRQDEAYERYAYQLDRMGVPVHEVHTDRLSEDEAVKDILEWMGFGWVDPKTPKPVAVRTEEIIP